MRRKTLTVKQLQYSLGAMSKLNLKRSLNILCQLFLKVMWIKDEPIVSKKVRGNITYWVVHDPSTNQTTYLPSETEARQWIERNYDHRMFR
uniref:Uncharacterized protein n=1 Tax=Oscillatoriales cyanobacterium SpSt-402 TaxID=2282168 RepID=A0A832M3G6_9CYAN